MSIERCAYALERIAAVLELMAAAEVEPAPCEHPQDARKDYSVMGREQWICSCGYEFGFEG